MIGNEKPLAEVQSEFLLYNTENGNTRVQVRMYEGSVWLSQRSIADLYERSVPTINKHITHIYDEGELYAPLTTRTFYVEQLEGDRTVSRPVLCYNLDMILAVGYRAKSSRGTQFRQWATKILHEYVQKGFALDDERLMSPPEFGEDYFNELLERIRVIRASEKRLYKKVLDIYALSIDYNKNMPQAQAFFQGVQNRIHFAVHHHTAAEILVLRAKAEKPNMGLTTWKNGPNGSIRKADITVAKNYLTEDELQEMNSLVNQYLEYAERQAKRRIPMTMQDWEVKLNEILKLNDKQILSTSGRVKHEDAKRRVMHEWEAYCMRITEEEKKRDDDEFENLLLEAENLPVSHSEKNGEFYEKR